MPFEPDLTEISKKLADDGFIIEAGWMGLRLAAIPPNAPDIQIELMRNAFFAGAQHLFASIMTILDKDDEATPADLRRLDLIHAELENFIKQFAHEHLQTQGNA